jgi:hypothetical protein
MERVSTRHPDRRTQSLWRSKRTIQAKKLQHQPNTESPAHEVEQPDRNGQSFAGSRCHPRPTPGRSSSSSTEPKITPVAVNERGRTLGRLSSDAREEAEQRTQARFRAAAMEITRSSSERVHRRFGELPPEPEIVRDARRHSSEWVRPRRRVA